MSGDTKRQKKEAPAASSYDFASMLKVFYDRVYPFKEMTQWLSYGDDAYFQRREFSMTFQGDVYARYQCYADHSAFAAAIRKSCPIKLDIGAVFNAKPSEHKTLAANLVPQQRELIFDIDLTDYDDVRVCCQKTRVCSKCFVFMAAAVSVLDSMLRQDLGFQHLLWVFSGRRGVHCWVCDESARKLNNHQRSQLAEYLSVHIDRNNVIDLPTSILHKEFLYQNVKYTQDKSSRWTLMYPSLHRLYNTVLLPQFEKQVLLDQVDFSNEEHQAILFQDVPAHVSSALKEEWAKSGDETVPTFKWKQFKATMIQCFEDKTIVKTNPILNVVFRYMYPRLDINVSKGINHLLKAPFVVHPSTGNVCVPFDASNVDRFDLDAVPKLSQIIQELDEHDGDVGKTAMASALRIFKSTFFDALSKSLRKERQIVAKEKQESGLDF